MLHLSFFGMCIFFWFLPGSFELASVCTSIENNLRVKVNLNAFCLFKIHYFLRKKTSENKLFSYFSFNRITPPTSSILKLPNFEFWRIMIFFRFWGAEAYLWPNSSLPYFFLPSRTRSHLQPAKGSPYLLDSWNNFKHNRTF